MKVQVGVDLGSYTFVAAAKTIAIAGYPTLTLNQVLLIANATRNVIYYRFDDATFPATIAANIVTVTPDTTGHANGDALIIILDVAQSLIGTGFVETTQSTTTQLGASATFNTGGSFIDLLDDAGFEVSVTTDQNGRLFIDNSDDGIIIRRISTFNVFANVPFFIALSPLYKFIRIRFTNDGGVTTTTFSIQSISRNFAIQPTIQRVGTPLTDNSIVQNVKAIGDRKATYNVAYKSATDPGTLVAATLALGGSVQLATIHHLLTAIKTVRLRRVFFEFEQISGTAVISIEISRLSTAPTGGTAITPIPSDSTDAAAEAVCIALPTVGGTIASTVTVRTLNLATSAASIEIPIITEVGLNEFKPPSLIAGVLEGYAVTMRTAAATSRNVSFTVNFEFSEE